MALPWKASCPIPLFANPEDGFIRGVAKTAKSGPSKTAKSGPSKVKKAPKLAPSKAAAILPKSSSKAAAAAKSTKDGASGSSKLVVSQKRKETPPRLTKTDKGKDIVVAEPEPKRQKTHSGVVLGKPEVEETYQAKIKAAEKELEKIIKDAAGDVWDPAEDHKEFLESNISDKGRHTGFVWGTGISQGFPDSILAHLPGYSRMQNEEDHLEVRAAYARETFRLTTTQHQKKWAEEHPDQVVGQVLRSLHDAGVYFGFLKDTLEHDKLGALTVTNDQETLNRAILERSHFLELAKGKDKERRIATGQAALNETKYELARYIGMTADAERKEAVAKAKRYKEKVEKHKSKVARLKSELKIRTEELRQARSENDLIRNTARDDAKKYLSKFLGSKAFAQAVPYAMKDMMTHTVYERLKVMGDFYPFKPENVGFKEVEAEKLVVRDLSSYGWDEEKDVFLNPDGSVFKEELQLENHPPSGIVHPWPKDKWPSHLDLPENAAEGGNEGVPSDSSTSDEEETDVDNTEEEVEVENTEVDIEVNDAEGDIEVDDVERDTTIHQGDEQGDELETTFPDLPRDEGDTAPAEAKLPTP